jgi:hypothetical protein
MVQTYLWGIRTDDVQDQISKNQFDHDDPVPLSPNCDNFILEALIN